jgi:hypothetical protein
MGVDVEVEVKDIPKECFEDSRLQVNIIDVVEVGKVRIDLQDPVWLDQGYRPNEDEACFATNEGSNLDPRDHVV